VSHFVDRLCCEIASWAQEKDTMSAILYLINDGDQQDGGQRK